MFSEFFRFELRYQLRSPTVWVIAFAFFLIAFAATTTDIITMGEGIGNVNRNAPMVILEFLSVFSVLGLLVAISLTAQPLLRDFDLGTEELFFSTPMRKSNYLWGRFAAGAVMGLVVLMVAAFGVMLGSFMPWLDPERLGAFSWRPYLWSFGVVLIPNLLFVAALLALLAVTTRRLLMVFLGVVAFLVLWSIAGSLTSDIKFDTLASLIDPFGERAISRVTRYWSVAERNTQVPVVDGLLLINRLIWLGFAAAMAVAAQLLFRTQKQRAKKRWWQRAKSIDAPPAATPARKKLLSVAREFGAQTELRQFAHLVAFDTKAVLKSMPFLVLLFFGLLNYIGGLQSLDAFFGTSIHPVTSVLMRSMQGSYQFLLFIVIAFYAGDVLWRERDAKLDQVSDSLPVPNWVPLLAKFGAIAAVVVVFFAVGVLASIVFQLAHGHTNLELGVYLRAALIDAWPYILIGALALFLQILSNQKFLGHLLMIIALLWQFSANAMGFEHNLYTFAAAPNMVYSDMNGFGHLLQPWAWFETYWTLCAAMLIVLAGAFWVRGSESRWRGRWKHAMAALRGPQGALLAGLTIAFIGVGGWIFYNTNVVNEYLTKQALLDRQALFEKEYRRYKDLPQPHISDVNAAVDIYPDERRAVVHGHYRLVNRSDAPIAELHVYTDFNTRLQVTKPADTVVKQFEPKLGVRILTLREPLLAGATMDFDFVIERHEQGFTNSGMPPAAAGGILESVLNANGTFFNSEEMMPHFGYNQGRQILDRNERRKRDLGDVPRAAKLEDESARGSMGFPDGEWLNFEATVSTSEDQVALAPGYLQREWTENGRRYFHYKMDQPMLPFYCFLSARWQVKRGEWQGLPIEIYYDAKHAYNVDRMIDATRKSLDYFTANFSPYQYKQVRILEFPRYSRFAQSFANTIPFSESIGFIADLKDAETVDYVFYVTAHEMAHQWWGHQVVGADVQGATMVMESMAQYSALMVMEKEYGREHMRRFLKYELDRYLKGRGGELIEELPLMRVENQQYIHYAKGSLIFYRLREEIGEENLNRALANFIRDKAWQKPPYTTTLEMLDYIRAQAPADKHAVIDELFAKIIFYDNRVLSASVTPRDGKYDVAIEYEAAKSESDGMGRQSDLPVDDWIDVAVFARGADEQERNEKPLYLQRQHITQARGTIKVTVDAMPYEVGFDPYNKLIDRIPDDNRKTVDEAQSDPGAS